MPRFLRLTEWYEAEHVPYLQHVEEARAQNWVVELYRLDWVEHRWTPKYDCKLPHTLRKLELRMCDYRDLTADTLPPRLTALALHDVSNVALQFACCPSLWNASA